jgi:hypothetical protein
LRSIIRVRDRTSTAPRCLASPCQLSAVGHRTTRDVPVGTPVEAITTRAMCRSRQACTPREGGVCSDDLPPFLLREAALECLAVPSTVRSGYGFLML